MLSTDVCHAANGVHWHTLSTVYLDWPGIHSATAASIPVISATQRIQYTSIYPMLLLLGIGSGQRQLIAVLCIAEHA